MPGILEKLNQELETIGKRAQAALEDGRLHLELMRLRHQRDNVASDLGRLFYQREKGTTVEQEALDAQMGRMDDVEAAIAKVEAQLGAIKAEVQTVDPQPAGAGEPGSEAGSPS